MINFSKRRIGEILLRENFISPQELEKGIMLQRKSDKRLGEILVEEGYISESDLFHALELHTGIPSINLDVFASDENTLLIPGYLARRHAIFPIRQHNNVITIAVNDPFNVFAVDDVKMVTGYDVQLTLVQKPQLLSAIKEYYREDMDADTYMRVYEESEQKSGYTRAESAGRIPTTELMDLIIEQATFKGASDIHIEPQQDILRIRFRIDGVLIEVAKLPLDSMTSIIQRIKVSANMDIAQRRYPQDGHMKFLGDKGYFDLRVSTMPTVNGEKVALRILDRKFSMRMNQLGFTQEQLRITDKMLRQRFGVILVTGSVGCGKTTTLYSMMQTLNTSSRNIVSLEEPVEYTIPGINQTQISSKGGLSYVDGIRSVLRQDPNIIMIGEIRDPNTAAMVVRAALSGSLVFSTLHTNNASGTVSRLFDINIEPYLLSSCLVGIISQTLVRKICVHCKVGYEPRQVERELLGLNDNVSTLWSGEGCEKCSFTGYCGRTAAAEIVLIDDDYRKLILKKCSPQEFDSLSQRKGVVSLKSSVLELLKEGITTVQEVVRTALFDG